MSINSNKIFVIFFIQYLNTINRVVVDTHCVANEVKYSFLHQLIACKQEQSPNITEVAIFECKGFLETLVPSTIFVYFLTLT